MGKRFLFLIGLLGLVLSLGFVQPASADFGVSVGEVYNYEIVQAGIYAKIGKDSAIGSGLVFANQHVDIGSTLSYEIILINELGVFWDLTIGDITVIHVSDPVLDLNSIENMFTAAISLPFSYSGDFNKTRIEMGILIPYFSPFFDPNHWNNITDRQAMMDYYISLSPTIVKDFALHSNASGYYLESSFHGPLVATIGITTLDMTFSNQFKLIFDESGVLQGVRLDAWAAGFYNEEKVNLHIKYQLELVGYNLPDFQYIGLENKTIGIEKGLLIATSAICSLTVVAIIKRKKSVN